MSLDVNEDGHRYGWYLHIHLAVVQSQQGMILHPGGWKGALQHLTTIN